MSDLKKLFEDYDKSAALPMDLLSNKDLTANPDLLKKHINEFKNHPKVKALVEIINSVIGKIKTDAKDIFDKFNVEVKITATDKLSEPILNAISFDFDKSPEKEVLNVNANFNFVKLAMMPGPEAYACVYNELFSTLLSKKQSMPKSNDYKFGKSDELKGSDLGVSGITNDSHFDREGNFVEPKNIILEYIKKFLRVALGIEKQDEENEYQSAKYITDEILQSGISVQDMFENPNGANVVAERYAKVSKKGTREQANFLLGEFSKGEFEALKNRNPSEVQAFCDKFARSFLANAGLSEGSYRITYNRVDSKGNLLSAGTYTDFGINGESININLDKILKMENPAEIVMTLSHELTHMLDSAQNKRDGNVLSGGYGLQDNLVGGTGEVKKFKDSVSPEVYDFLVELETVCYRVNPNEVSARLGEMVALEFMEGLHADEDMRKCIAESRKGYNAYILKINTAMEEAESMAVKYNQIKGSIRGSELNAFIESRLNYIELLKKKGRLRRIDGKEQMNVNAAHAAIQHSGSGLTSESEGLVQ